MKQQHLKFLLILDFGNKNQTSTTSGAQSIVTAAGHDKCKGVVSMYVLWCVSQLMCKINNYGLTILHQTHCGPCPLETTHRITRKTLIIYSQIWMTYSMCRYYVRTNGSRSVHQLLLKIQLENVWSANVWLKISWSELSPRLQHSLWSQKSQNEHCGLGENTLQRRSLIRAVCVI